MRLVPGHCDPTVNLYDWYVGIRGDRVESRLADHGAGRGVLRLGRPESDTSGPCARQTVSAAID